MDKFPILLADSLLYSPAQMLGNEGVIVVDVQLGALASPARSLCNGQRHNEMPNQRNKELLMNQNKGHY